MRGNTLRGMNAWWIIYPNHSGSFKLWVFVWNQWEEAYHGCPEQKSVLEETGASPASRYGGMYVWKDFPARELRHQTGRAGQSHFCAQRWILLTHTMHKCKKQESNSEVFAGNHNDDVCALKSFMLACWGQCKFYLWVLWNRVRVTKSTLETWTLI